jgi:hypothetical protein
MPTNQCQQQRALPSDSATAQGSPLACSDVLWLVKDHWLLLSLLLRSCCR